MRWRAVALALAFVVPGYLSNAVMSLACERATSRWLDAKLAASPTNRPGRQVPGGAAATYRLPWLASVQYDRAVGDLGGEKGRRYYLCLFGYALPLRNDVEIQAGPSAAAGGATTRSADRGRVNAAVPSPSEEEKAGETCRRPARCRPAPVGLAGRPRSAAPGKVGGIPDASDGL